MIDVLLFKKIRDQWREWHLALSAIWLHLLSVGGETNPQSPSLLWLLIEQLSGERFVGPQTIVQFSTETTDNPYMLSLQHLLQHVYPFI